MLKPTVGTEIDFRSSLFLKKFTIVDFPELLRPMIKMLICFGFLSLFKILLNNFSNTIFRLSFEAASFWNVYFQLGYFSFVSFYVLMEILNIRLEMPKIQFTWLIVFYHFAPLELMRWKQLLQISSSWGFTENFLGFSRDKNSQINFLGLRNKHWFNKAKSFYVALLIPFTVTMATAWNFVSFHFISHFKFRRKISKFLFLLWKQRPLNWNVYQNVAIPAIFQTLSAT